MTNNNRSQEKKISNTKNSRKNDDQLANIRKESQSWKIGGVFWGLLFITIGILALLGNFGIAQVNWSNIWRLWPIVLVAIGLSIIPLMNWVWKFLSIGLVISTMAAIVWAAIGGVQLSSYKTETIESNIEVSSSVVVDAEVSIKAGAVDLNIGTHNNDLITSAQLTSNITSLSKSSIVSGTTQRISFETQSSDKGSWWLSDITNQLEVNISKKMPIKLNIDTGASDGDIDVSDAKITQANIKTGASDIVIKLGDKEKTVDMNIDSGASSIVVRLPKSSGIELKLESGLTATELADLFEVSPGLYRSSEFSSTTNRIYIVGKIGTSSFKIERY